jgi:hypothetical protein
LLVALAVIVCVGPTVSQQASAAQSPDTPSSEPNPVVTGPITGGVHGRPWMGTPFNVADYGYSQQGTTPVDQQPAVCDELSLALGNQTR